MDAEIRVLHVDDEPEFTDMAATFLERKEERLTVETAPGPLEGLDFLEEHDVDCIVSDFEMPEQDGIGFLKSVREYHPDIPFILFTGKGSEEIASEAISAGITDYLQKSTGSEQFDVLANRICNAVDQYRAQRAIEASERRLEETYERITDGFFAVDADWQYTYVNEEGARIVGYDRDELIGNTVWEAFPELTDSPFEEALRTAHDTGEKTSIEEYYPAHDTWYSVQVYPDESGISIFFKDITERKQQEAEPSEVEWKFKTLAEHSLDITTVLDKDGIVQYQSPSIEDILGYQQSELIGESVFDYVHPDDLDHVTETFATVLDSDGPEIQSAEYRFKHADGSWVWIETAGYTQPVADEDSFVCTSREVTDRKEYEQLLETTIDSLPGFVFRHRMEPGWPLDYVRGSVDEITGYTEAELGEEISMAEDIIHPEDRELVRSHSSEGLDEEGGYELEYRIKTKDGSVKWIREHGSIQDDPISGEEVFIGFITDITEQKEYELKLEHERERFEALFTNFPEPTLATDMVDGDPIIRAVNPAFEETFGIDEDDAIGTSVNQLVVPDELMDDAEDIDKEVREGNIIDAEVLRQTAEGRRHFNVRSIPIGLEEGPDAFVIYADINERKRREEHFRRLHEVDAAFSDCDTTEEIYSVLVDAAEDVLEYDLAIADAVEDEVLVPKAVSTELPASSYYDETSIEAEDNLAAKAFRTGETSLIDDLTELPITPADAEYRSVLTVPIGDFGVFQTVSKAVGTFDETDKDLAEVLVAHAREHLIRIENKRELLHRTEELKRQNERLDDFASIVSHDLKNPLNVASGRLALAMEECNSEHLADIERAHDRMDTLIENLLELARLGDQVSTQEPVEVRPLIDACWRNVESSEATLENEIHGTIIADSNRLQQLLENLFSNAIEHAGEDVDITVGNVDDGFFVEDSGPGVPTNARESLFEVGFTTKEDGTGFGLNIVKQVVDAHDWNIEVGTGLHGGARFEITGIEFVE